MPSDLNRELREAAETVIAQKVEYEGHLSALLPADDALAAAELVERYLALCSPDNILSLLDKADAAEGLAEALTMARRFLGMAIPGSKNCAATVADEALANYRAQEPSK